MQKFTKILSYIAIGIFVLGLGGLAGWYFFTSQKGTSAKGTTSGFGAGNPTPTFQGSTGSTQANILATTNWTNGGNSGSSVASTQLWEVDTTPVAGFGFVANGTSTPLLYYTERANGYVESTNLSTRSSVRVTKDLRPKIYTALFSNDGSVVLRSISDKGVITTSAGTIKTITTASSTNTSLDVASFPDNITGVAVNPATRSIFYLAYANTTNGGTVGITAQWDGTKQKQVFSSLVNSWRPLYLSDGRIFLTESAADDLPGYAFQLNTDGSLTDIIRGVPGLTISPDPSSKAFIYGQSAAGELSLFVQTAPNATSSPLALATIADKCVWAPGKSETVYCAVPKFIDTKTFINDWYRGQTHTNDIWWQINAVTGGISQVYSPSASDGVTLDVENPQIDSTGTYIAFTNAADESLWVLKITK